MRARRRIAAVFGAGLLIAGCGGGAQAQHSGCYRNGDIVTFEGVASDGARPSEWLLNLSQPVCVESREISAIRIVGTPPPLRVPLQLTGKLLLGKSARDTTMFVALSVIRGRKMNAVAFVPTPLVPRHMPASPLRRMTDERCDAPPFGGTQPDYQIFVRRFGRIMNPQKILAGICKAKYSYSPRDGLHRLGFTDAKINAESTEQLAADTIRALKKLVNTIE